MKLKTRLMQKKLKLKFEQELTRHVEIVCELKNKNIDFSNKII